MSGADLAVFGHVHNSQRFAPQYKNKADTNGMQNPKAPMYIVAGTAGNIERLAPTLWKPANLEFLNDKDYAYATITFVDENNLRVDFIKSTTGEVLDTSTLYKSHEDRFVKQ
ncbi:hypothetical protein BJX68DRAFT_267323 [Aspergillus pseudodeflectus]|uniref:Purple acid phosphatase C-terminal domain-containing protein n=1 Tax=Aspergillus pseudodeflectus TaxID=176178 RepID=A0ABR4K9L2_9EURO